MNNVDEVVKVISIGLLVADFLLKTNRFLKAMELCKECLFVLRDTGSLKDKISKLFYTAIRFTIWKACRIISDNTSAIRYAEEIIQIHRESGERLEECELSINLAVMFLHECKYAQAKKSPKKRS